MKKFIGGYPKSPRKNTNTKIKEKDKKETMIDTNLTLDTNLTEEQIEKIIMCINFFIENCKFENDEENEILLDVLRIQTVLNATIAMNTLSANPKYIN